MAGKILVERSQRPGIESQNIEIVERKGIGHPDTLADGLSEAVSGALSQEYLDRFGNILHHNTDKTLVIGGSAEPEFRGGIVKKPISVVIAGRGTSKAGDQEIPINKIAKRAARDYLEETIRFLDVQENLEIDSRIGSGSVDLRDVFEREGVPSANDTSIGIAYAPLSETEKLVLRTEKVLNSEKTKRNFPPIGEDIKVMAQRENDHIDLTVAMATISSLLDDLDHYLSLKEEISDYICGIANDVTDKQVEVHVNTADEPEEGIVYRTVTGTSAEQGDDGMTGRGNRVNGLITFDRPMSLEASAGKNPVNHVGKLYNLLAREIAQEVSELEGIREVFVRALSQIGQPIDRPRVLNIRLSPEEGVNIGDLKEDTESIAEDHLENIQGLTRRIVDGELTVY
ncbi:S-adenosylmethionine synthetase [candidate division MSBL1 archaeon SCGC-AAA259A05]|uniref:S-adenosylmethionine synthetase n=1 Tax=candidate division MSBL1 archaeon SCGC-AAA259A05 TaxID=1698259 RepID=A0A133U975_9EURY|nr:S-adenosylmethionine synthetase [candidate division MSBL1 archaeon SCGC-AAA259A05]